MTADTDIESSPEVLNGGLHNNRKKFSKRSAFCLIFSMIISQNVWGWNTQFAGTALLLNLAHLWEFILNLITTITITLFFLTQLCHLSSATTILPYIVAYTVVAIANAIYCMAMCELYSHYPFAGGKLTRLVFHNFLLF